jgi:hypothetical protein
MFNILNHKGNTNQNQTKIASQPSQICNHQENKQQQMLVSMQGKAVLIHWWWKSKLVQMLWKSIWRFLKNLK